jgi:hypothetical protein
MSSMREYEEKLLEEKRMNRIQELISQYSTYLCKLDKYKIDSIYESNSFELGARRV